MHFIQRIMASLSLACVGYVTAVSIAAAQELGVGSHRIWIPAMNQVANSENATKSSGIRELDLREGEELATWFPPLKQQLQSTVENGTEWEATLLYQRLCRLVHTKNRSMALPSAFESSVAFSAKFDLLPRATQRHPTVGWGAGSYALTMSPHFVVATQGSTKQAMEIARLCEQTLAVWQQLFFPIWCDAGRLRQALRGGEELRLPLRARLQVVVFRNRESYLKQLQQFEPNVAVSTGYYSPQLATVFCYWDDATSEVTLRHELTHQFFSQVASDDIVAPESMPSDFWVVEGLALYMESIQISHRDGYDVATVGGWDAARLQPARYRRLHDESWIPWDEFRSAHHQRFRRGGDELKQWYSQAGGLTHFWLDRDGESRRAFFDYVKSVYRGQPQSENLTIAASDDILRRAYDSFLLLSSGQLSREPPAEGTKEIVLSRCQVASEILLAWPPSKRTLDWLDLSFTNVDDRLFLDANVSSATHRWNIVRLNLESTQVTDRGLSEIGQMPRLEELDLSHCDVSDRGLEALRGQRTLKTLWLTGNTKITDQALEIFASLPKLDLVDVSQTSVTEEGWQKLLSKSPRLRKKGKLR